MRAAPSLRVPRSRQLYWAAVFGLLLLASLCSLAVYLFSADWLNTAGTQPVALHSGLRADYSADLRGLKPLALSMGLIGEAARDRQPSATDPLPALEILLQTPVAWVTSTGSSPTSVPPTQAATTTFPGSGVTPPAPSATKASTATLEPTLTPTPTFTATLTASAARPTQAPPTHTQPPPTDTRPPSVTRPPTSTSTQPPPPTATRTPRPPTQPPPTAYPPPGTVPPTPNPYP